MVYSDYEHLTVCLEPCPCSGKSGRVRKPDVCRQPSGVLKRAIAELEILDIEPKDGGSIEDASNKAFWNFQRAFQSLASLSWEKFSSKGNKNSHAHMIFGNFWHVLTIGSLERVVR